MQTPRDVVEVLKKMMEMTAGVQGLLATKKSGPHLSEDLSEIMIPRDMQPLSCDENLLMSKNVGSNGLTAHLGGSAPAALHVISLTFQSLNQSIESDHKLNYRLLPTRSSSLAFDLSCHQIFDFH